MIGAMNSERPGHGAVLCEGDDRTDEGLPAPISVLLPVFNAERYVAAAVESILAQTFADFEFIVIDDGSTDASLSILTRYAKTDRRIRLVSRENRGLVATLNEMAELARGPFLARMDADDISHSTRFERQVAFLRANPGVAAVGSRGLYIDPDGDPLKEFVDPLTHEEINAALLIPQLGIIHPSAMIRSDALLQVRGYRSEYKDAEDLDLWLRLGEAHQLHNINEVLISYRVHPAGVSNSRFVEQWQSAGRAVDAALVRRGLPPVARRSLPMPDASPSDAHRRWAWWALGAGNLSSAWKHALRLIGDEPLAMANWRLFVCVLRDSLIRQD